MSSANVAGYWYAMSKQTQLSFYETFKASFIRNGRLHLFNCLYCGDASFIGRSSLRITKEYGLVCVSIGVYAETCVQ